MKQDFEFHPQKNQTLLCLVCSRGNRKNVEPFNIRIREIRLYKD